MMLSVLFALCCTILPHQLPENDSNNSLHVSITSGSITGIVQLSTKPRGVRSGGGLYGRSSRNTPNTVTNDSVLVILSGDAKNEIRTDDYAILNQFDRKFQPGILPIQLGQTVRITNSDPVYHNVFSLTSPHKFDVGRRPKGEHYDVSFEKPGMVDVFCDIHSNMHAIIYVLPPDAIQWKKIANGEQFQFDGVSEGAYSLTFFAMGYSEEQRNVTITSDGTADAGIITLNP